MERVHIGILGAARTVPSSLIKPAQQVAEAEQMAEAAYQSKLVLMEAFHYRYHPLAARMKEIISNGELGTFQRIEAWLCFPLLSRNDIRYNLSLAGGATMDAGSYALFRM